jgi:organic radical activating enzyme
MKEVKDIKKLAVSEVFYSIQGEGQTMGIPAVFLRLGGCNLLCESESWICDTIEVWRKSNATLFEDVLQEDWIDKLRNGAHLVITGGEPMLHEKAIRAYISWFNDEYNFVPIIEMETNGTIEPCNALLALVRFWNVSPKLSTAGKQNKRELRINTEALRTFDEQEDKTIFKFVISCEEDITEVFEDFGPHISGNKLVLMPAGSSQEELMKTRIFVAEKCRDLNVRYSERLHVVIWNLKTGV